MDRRRSHRNGPKHERGCILARDLGQLAAACTNHTTQQADPNTRDASDIGDDDGSGDDDDAGECVLRQMTTQTQSAGLTQQRTYASKNLSVTGRPPASN
jgi:hypothetical protein